LSWLRIWFCNFFSLKHCWLLQCFSARFFFSKIIFFILFFNIELVKNYSYNMLGKHYNFFWKLLLIATVFFPTWFFSVNRVGGSLFPHTHFTVDYNRNPQWFFSLLLLLLLLFFFFANFCFFFFVFFLNFFFNFPIFSFFFHLFFLSNFFLLILPFKYWPG